MRRVGPILLGLIGLPFALVFWLVLLLFFGQLVGFDHLYRVPAASMEPTLHCAGGYACEGRHQDRVLVVRYLLHAPARADLVAFHTPAAAERLCGAGGVYLKRIVGLPGERIEERSGTLYVDGHALEEPYIAPARRDAQTVRARRLGPDDYYVLGDNRAQSCDSRHWGPLHRSAIIGHVAAIYWPVSRIRRE